MSKQSDKAEPLRERLPKQFPALCKAIEGFRNPYSEQSYREVEAAYDELTALADKDREIAALKEHSLKTIGNNIADESW